MRKHTTLGIERLERREVLAATTGIEVGLTNCAEDIDVFTVDLSDDNMMAFDGGDVDSDDVDILLSATPNDDLSPSFDRGYLSPGGYAKATAADFHFPTLDGSSKDACKVSSGDTLKLDTTGVDTIFEVIQIDHHELTHDPEFQDWASAFQGNPGGLSLEVVGSQVSTAENGYEVRQRGFLVDVPAPGDYDVVLK